MATCEQQGPFLGCVGLARFGLHTGTTSASLCGRNPLRVVGLCRDTATGRHGRRHRECPPTATPEHVMEHAWADRPKLHSGIDVQHAITGHTTPIAEHAHRQYIYMLFNECSLRVREYWPGVRPVTCVRLKSPGLMSTDRTTIETSDKVTYKSVRPFAGRVRPIFRRAAIGPVDGGVRWRRRPHHTTD